MNESEDKIKDPTPCPNCNGTGKVAGRPTTGGDAANPASYGDGACPVCGGTGKAPGPTVSHKDKNRLCFVATAAFGDPDCAELVMLRRFRDETLLPRPTGRAFVNFYYRVGPHLAHYVSRRPRLRSHVRRSLSAFCRYLSRNR